MCFPPFSIIPHRPSLFNINTIYTDEDVIPKEIVTHMERTNATVDDANTNNVQVAMKTLQSPDKCDSTTFQPAPNELMPVRKRAHRNVGSECREILNGMKSMTYLVSNYDDLSAIKKELITLHKKMSEACPSDSGLLLETMMKTTTAPLAMEFPEWGGSIHINNRNISMVNTCPIDNWLVITYIILQLYPPIYKGLSNMVTCPGAKMLLRLYELYKQKMFSEAKWYLAQLNNLSAHTTKDGQS